MTKYIIAFVFIAHALLVFGQEVLVPLQSTKAPRTQTTLTKNAADFPINFPLIDHFITPQLDTLYWQNSNITLLSQAVIFNAQDSLGNTYNNADGSFGVCDELTSKPINLLNINAACYFSFDIEIGSTWQTGDSLVLQFLNAAGNWDNVWASPPIAIENRNIQLPVELGLLYKHATFQFRFVNYGSKLANNTKQFILQQVIFATKLTLPFADNIFWSATHTYKPTWSLMQGWQGSGVNHQIGWGNIIRLNGLNYDSIPYNNGYNDTIQSHTFDLSNLVSADSVYFRFFYKAISTSATDSLIIYFKNNTGLWVRQHGISATQSNSLSSFITNVNKSRINHSNFEFRIVTKGTSNLASDTLKWIVSGFSICKKVNLPFIDDFSTSTQTPDAQKWVNKLVDINNTFPISPPSINVATFDGLDRIGVPYGVGRGYCDTLTSLPIRLDGLTESDSVYLTFFVQPQGFGAENQSDDSLILEARFTAASTDSFKLLWRGAPQSFYVDSFVQVRIRLTNQFLHDNFELRFKNRGSRTGNLSHWNLDYIQLDKGRTVNDAMFDVAIQTNPSPLLKKYTSMPYAHFKVNAANHLSDTQYFSVKNNDNTATGAVTYGRELFNQNFSRIDTFGSALPQLDIKGARVAGIKKSVVVNDAFNTDSVILWSRYFTKLGTSIDNIRSNDTLWQSTYFGNYYAFDDGSAEWGYGIENATGKVALKYTFAKPDSLYGIAIHFNRANSDVSQLQFNVMVWQNIDLPEQVLLKIPATAIYFNARNGFHYIKFDKPIFIQNTCYVGWEQTQQFILNVGLDMNHKVNYKRAPNPDMFYSLDGGLWYATALKGALMIRPIVGKWIDPPPVGMKPIADNNLNVSIYPNPTTGVINIENIDNTTYTIVVADMLGKQILVNSNVYNQINLQDVKTGLYLLHLTDNTSGLKATKKIIITQ